MQPHRMSGHAVHLQSRAHGSLLEDNIARKVPDPDLERRVLLIGLPFRLRAQQQAGTLLSRPTASHVVRGSVSSSSCTENG